MENAALKHTPLYRQHVELGAKMVEFGGWEMPVQYTGIVAEHRAVRTSAGLFDVSHMGQIQVSGAGARDFLQYLAANDIRKLKNGRCQYSFLLNERGGTIDDMMVYRTGPDAFTLVVNASNAETDWAHVVCVGAGRKDVHLENKSGDRALLAFQGPAAGGILSNLTPDDVGAIRFHGIRPCTVAGLPVWLAASGYTGENGFEIFAASSDVEQLWRALLDAGRDKGAVPVGLGARDNASPGGVARPLRARTGRKYVSAGGQSRFRRGEDRYLYRLRSDPGAVGARRRQETGDAGNGRQGHSTPGLRDSRGRRRARRRGHQRIGLALDRKDNCYGLC